MLGFLPTINSGIPPAISNLSIENKTYNPNNLSLNFTTDKPAPWIGYSLDGKANITIAENSTLAGLADGPHNLIIYANDTVGNMGTSGTMHFSVDVPKQGSLPTLIGVSASIIVMGIGLVVFFRKRSHK